MLLEVVWSIAIMTYLWVEPGGQEEAPLVLAGQQDDGPPQHVGQRRDVDLLQVPEQAHQQQHNSSATYMSQPSFMDWCLV